MSEATATETPTTDAPRAPIRLIGQFIKDFSFEVPHAPEIFGETRQDGPQITLGLDTAVRHLNGDAYEVILSIQADAMLGQKKAFIVELSYGALVDIDTKVVPEAHIHPILLVEVPRQMFPFVRQIVSQMTAEGGFPPLMLQLLDFADLYRKKFGDTPQAVPRNDAPQPAVH